MDVCAVTHRGKVRSENEDTIYISGKKCPLFAMVADGMGGHAAGQTASSTAVRLVVERLRKRDLTALTPLDLKGFLEEVSYELWQMAQENPSLSNMGTTFTLAVVLEDRILAAHVGDSRAYLLRRGHFNQLTTDHSYVQFLVEKGILTPEEAEHHPYRNIITRALGMEEVTADAYSASFGPDSALVICSDGLLCHVKDEEICECLKEAGDARQKAQALRDLALERGGRDNISIIVVLRDSGRTEK